MTLMEVVIIYGMELAVVVGQEQKNTSQRAKQDVHAHVFLQLDMVSL